MPFKTTLNCRFNDIWCYLVTGSFDWKIGIFQQTVVRVYCILKTTYKTSYENNMSHSALIDHIITYCEDKVTQSGVNDTSLSDHQLIFCTRKIKRVKTNNQKQIFFLSNYTMENFERELKNIAFPNYDNLSDVNSAYNDLVKKNHTSYK